MKQIIKYLALLSTGGLIYITIELLWRGSTHWTMFLVGGLCFVACGLINEIIPWSMPLWLQGAIGVGIVTAIEFLAGCIINRWLGWGVWDYSGLPGNLLGQICLQYAVLWIPLVLVAIVLDDWLRHWWFGQERPYYKLK